MEEGFVLALSSRSQSIALGNSRQELEAAVTSAAKSRAK